MAGQAKCYSQLAQPGGCGLQLAGRDEKTLIFQNQAGGPRPHSVLNPNDWLQTGAQRILGEALNPDMLVESEAAGTNRNVPYGTR